MNRPTQTTFDVLAIQRCMAEANPLAWRDAFVVEIADTWVGIALLDGASEVLRVVGPQVDLAVGRAGCLPPGRRDPRGRRSLDHARI